jgi:hypothetical protein
MSHRQMALLLQWTAQALANDHSADRPVAVPLVFATMPRFRFHATA